MAEAKPGHDGGGRRSVGQARPADGRRVGPLIGPLMGPKDRAATARIRHSPCGVDTSSLSPDAVPQTLAAAPTRPCVRTPHPVAQRPHPPGPNPARAR